MKEGMPMLNNTRMRSAVVTFVIAAGASAWLVAVARAQAPAKAGAAQAKSGATSKTGAANAAARGAAAAPGFQVEANLAQLMKGILFPNSNVVFAAQDQNPADVPPAKDPSLATNPLASTYGKWEAVENSGLAIAEAANLLLLPGRKCSNGLDVPLRSADWPKLVQGLREAGMTAYRAAQSKNQDNILMAADTMATACANCHDKYREKENRADRCR
jgi:cytochrome c553